MNKIGIIWIHKRKNLSDLILEKMERKKQIFKNLWKNNFIQINKNESKIQNEYFVNSCKILKYKILLKMKVNKLEYDKRRGE